MHGQKNIKLLLTQTAEIQQSATNLICVCEHNSKYCII